MTWLLRLLGSLPLPSTGFLVTVFAVALIASHGAVWFKGRESGMQKLWDYQAEQARETVRVVTKQGEVTERVIVKFRERIKRVEVQGETIVERVPYIVPAGRRLSNGWVRLHDSATDGTLPEPAPGIDGAVSAITEAHASGVVAHNYTLCRADQERLTGLQEWARGQFEAMNGKPLGY